jgi:2-hydroxy-6-oxonona-2,4-dienedioate hydrolase
MHVHFRSVLLFTALAAATPLVFSQNQSALPPEKVASVFGQNIRYFEAGSGPVVILLHGLGAVKEIWMPSFGTLGAKFHVYAIDQIGFGHSDKPLREYKIATFADFLHGFMQTQDIAKATLVGNSLGGWIALDFAAQYPAMVDKLVLVDSAGMPWTQQSPRIDLNPSSLAGTRALLESLFYDKTLVRDEFV